MRSKEVQDSLVEIKGRLSSAHGARLKGVVLYGSESRGDARPDSDIDLLVLLEGELDYGRELWRNVQALYPVAKRLGRRISAKPVLVDDYNSVRCPLYLNAHKEGVML